MTTTMLDRAVSRTPVIGHDGRSGATLERVLLDDGRRLIVKTTRPGEDLTATIGGGRIDRELELWAAGHLDDLPAGVGHCILDVSRDQDVITTVMRDLGEAVVGWKRMLTRSEGARVLGAAASLHSAFVGRVPEGLCALEDRLVMLSPQSMAPLRSSSNPLPAAVVRGWEIFADLAPGHVVDAVLAVFEEPRLLADPLSRSAPTTLNHGDPWLVNLALEPDAVVMLDWGLATAGPAVLDFASFLAGNSSRVQASREELIADFCESEGSAVSDESLRLGLFAGLIELAWNKALDSVDNPDPAVRAREHADFDWWVSAAVPAIEHDL